jgi:hypothetical protein
MNQNQLNDFAVKYRVEDLPESSIPGTPLANVIRRLELAPEYIPEVTKEYLRKNRLKSLLNYACKQLSFNEFSKVAKLEQNERRLAADRIKKEHDTRNIAKAKQVKLRRKYGLDYFIKKADFPKLMNILLKVENRVRLFEDEVVWLSTGGDEYFTTKLRESFHQNEAEFHAGEFAKSKDPWSAVNASSHYRKCNKAIIADSMLCMIDVSILKNRKLKSALCTTHGGVKRDIKKYDEALGLGEQAHLLTPKDFRPCTLLGAVNIEIGNHYLGHSWFRKAVERGYSENSVDRELRSIFMRAEKTKQDALRDNLLKMDPVRYSWAKKRINKKLQKRAGRILPNF